MGIVAKMSAKFCKNCGNELPLSYTVNYCPNCGHLIKKENRIAKYTSDGKPVIQGQENISTKATDPISKVSNVGAPTKNATPLNSSSHVGKTGSGHMLKERNS
jgi:predicted RNA-binding Zn-ribbon protein involved in translation (DUF1610 family)